MEWSVRKLKVRAWSLAEETMKKAGPGSEDLGIDNLINKMTLFWTVALRRANEIKKGGR